MNLSVQRLKAIASGGAASIAVSIGVTNFLKIFSGMTLTRLLDASAYGIVGILMSISVSITMLSDIGAFPFIVRHKEGDDPRFLDEIWTLRLLRSVALTILTILLAYPIAAFMGRPELTLVLSIWAFSFLIDGLSGLAFATAVRERALWRLSFLDLFAIIVQIIVSIALAIIFRSYWAMVWAMLAGAVGKAILSYTLFPGSVRRFRLSRKRSAELWQFTKFLAPSSALWLLVTQSDKLFLGRALSLEEFGFYSVATALTMAMSAPAVPYATRVLFPQYATAVQQSAASLPAIFYSARRKVELLYMLAMGGVIGCAALIVEILYDDRYRPVAVILSILTISSAVRFNNWAADQALMALGRVRVTLFANIARAVWLFGGGIVAVLWLGPMGLIWVVGLLEVAGLTVYWWWLAKEGLFDLRKEMLGFVACIIGCLLGLAASSIGLSILRYFHA